MNPLQELSAAGQSPWLDNLKRSYLKSGELQSLVGGGIRGVTSNPTIFQKAISGSSDYDDQFRRLVATMSVEDLYWELVIDDIYGEHAVKLPAGDMVVYPASSLHHVKPVTRGVRLASFFWVQSMVRDDGHRTLLFDLDMAINKVNQALHNHGGVVELTNCYHNLLRRFAEV